MKIVLTGANGLLGQHLIKKLAANGYAVVALGRGASRLPIAANRYYDADITNEALVHEILFNEKPDVIVHAAAMTQVDECEQRQDKCFEVNVQSTAHLLVSAEQFAGFFIFISTDFVFDGQQGNYLEQDVVNPVNWYGFTKVQAENIVESAIIPSTIIRTCLVYGNSLTGTRDNIITWVKRNLEEGKEISVVSDQIRTPTYVEDLAEGILLTIRKKATGIYHISGKDVLTPYEMAMATAKYFNLNTRLIKQVDASIFSQPARRPLKTGFDISKAKNDLGFQPLSFEETLQKMFASREPQLSSTDIV